MSINDKVLQTQRDKIFEQKRAEEIEASIDEAQEKRRKDLGQKQLSRQFNLAMLNQSHDNTFEEDDSNWDDEEENQVTTQPVKADAVSVQSATVSAEPVAAQVTPAIASVSQVTVNAEPVSVQQPVVTVQPVTVRAEPAFIPVQQAIVDAQPVAIQAKSATATVSQAKVDAQPVKPAVIANKSARSNGHVAAMRAEIEKKLAGRSPMQVAGGGDNRGVKMGYNRAPIPTPFKQAELSKQETVKPQQPSVQSAPITETPVRKQMQPKSIATTPVLTPTSVAKKYEEESTKQQMTQAEIVARRQKQMEDDELFAAKLQIQEEVKDAAFPSDEILAQPKARANTMELAGGIAARYENEIKNNQQPHVQMNANEYLYHYTAMLYIEVQQLELVMYGNQMFMQMTRKAIEINISQSNNKRDVSVNAYSDNFQFASNRHGFFAQRDTQACHLKYSMDKKSDRDEPVMIGVRF